MQTDLDNRILRAIARQRMFRAGDRIGVGVSGGADSVALLRLLDDLRGELGVRLAVLHFNHQLRGVESDGDEQFVAALAAGRGLEFFAGRDDVAGVAKARGWNLEDAARRLRYGFFSSVVDAGHVNRVAVAHTADDQAETVLARMVRGAGPGGLAAIYPVKTLNGSLDWAIDGIPRGAPQGCTVVRPLLEIRRDELRQYLARLDQSWREDSSNLDTTRLRAKLRHQILPIIERDLQPAIVEHLGRLARMAREDEAFWTTFVSERLSALMRREGYRCGIRCADLLAPLPWAAAEMPPAEMPEDGRFALTRRLVRGIVEILRGDCRQLTAQHVEQVLHLATASPSGHGTELPGIVVERSFDWLWFSAAERKTGAGVEADAHESNNVTSRAIAFCRTVELGPVGESTVIVIPEIARRFRLKVIDWPEPERDTRYETGTLDRDLLGSPLVLRSWRPGDSFRPQGRRSVHKLKHFLLTSRVARRDREGWPVLTSAGALVWTRGFPVAAEFAPRKATRIGVVVAEEEI